jgi:hypothetical protein
MAKRAYQMKLVVLVDDGDRQTLIDTARQIYRESGGVPTREADGIDVSPEETSDTIWQTCYPGLGEFLFSDEVIDDAGNVLPEAEGRVREAVECERKRLWGNQPTDQPATELGGQLAVQTGTSAVVADHYVRLPAKRILKSNLGAEGKPN